MTALKKGAIYVDDSLIHGRGVFADQNFIAGDIIEECHLFTVAKHETAIYDYTFLVTNLNREKCIGFVLGYGAIYNHSDQPNATYEYDEENFIIRFFALRAIQPGEEILTNYGAGWFSVREVESAQLSNWFRCRMFLRRHRQGLRFLLLGVAMLQLLILNYFW